MKNKGLIILTIIFFLVVNTTYYWEGKLGHSAFLAFMLIGVGFLVLTITLAWQILLLIKENFTNKQRLLKVALLITVLGLTYYKPAGLFYFNQIESNDVLVAQREGAANCTTTLRLKDDFSFIERVGCFGVSEVSGTFRAAKDTIYFENIQTGRDKNDFYKFALIVPANFNSSNAPGGLIRYKDISDTIGHGLWITKNELNKLKDKKLSRYQEASLLKTTKSDTRKSKK